LFLLKKTKKTGGFFFKPGFFSTLVQTYTRKKLISKSLKVILLINFFEVCELNGSVIDNAPNLRKIF